MAREKIEKKIPSALPLYIAAGVFLVSALIVPVYHIGGFAVCCALTAVGYAVAKKKIPPRIEYIDAPEQPFATGEAALDEVLSKAQHDLTVLAALNERIPDQQLSAQIDRMEKAGEAILQQIRLHPEQARSIRRFATYYLPTSVRILTSYAELCASGARGENAKNLMSDVEKNAATIAQAFEVQLDALFAGTVLDVSAEIDVLDSMLSGDGLTGQNRIKLN